MKDKTMATDPNDRKVILVVSKKGLTKIAARAEVNEIIDYVSDSPMSPLGWIGRAAKNVIINGVRLD